MVWGAWPRLASLTVPPAATEALSGWKAKSTRPTSTSRGPAEARVGPAAAGGPAQASAGPREVDVGAVDFGFEPNDASVAAGGKVRVTNKGKAPHTFTLDDVALDSGTIDPGSSADLTAPDAPGSYSYRCTIHPAQMRGVLVVLGPDTGDPNAKAAAPGPAPPAQSSGGGPGAGVSAFALAAAVVAAFLGGVGISAFALRRRAAT